MGVSRLQILVRTVAAAFLILSGTVLSETRPATATTAPAARVQAFGLPSHPDLVTSAKPVTAITATVTGGGYWLVAGDGGVFGYGNAPYLGSLGNVALSKPIVGMAPTPSGSGYWLVGSDGGIFTFGDATFFGSTGKVALSQPIVGMAATGSGNGYWLVAGDGGIFAFGDAAYLGSAGGIALSSPIVGMAATSSGNGYWLVAGDGGVFAYGQAVAAGSVPGIGTSVTDVVGLGRSSTGAGYLIVSRTGSVWTFGDAIFRGTASLASNRAIVGLATAAGGYWLADADNPPPPPPLPPPPIAGPTVPPGSGAGRRIVYCNPCQRVWLIEANGTTSRTYRVSGRVATPRPGTYAVYSKSRYAGAGHDGITMEYMTRFAQGRSLAIGFHTIPRRANGTPLQSLAELGTFRSAGCIRQNPVDAIALWNFAPIGTPVIVT